MKTQQERKEAIEIQAEALRIDRERMMAELKMNMRVSDGKFTFDAAHPYIGVFCAAFGGSLLKLGGPNFLTFEMYDHVNGIPLNVTLQHRNGRSLQECYSEVSNNMEMLYDAGSMVNEDLSGRDSAKIHDSCERLRAVLAHVKPEIDRRKALRDEKQPLSDEVERRSKEKWTTWLRIKMMLRWVLLGKWR